MALQARITLVGALVVFILQGCALWQKSPQPKDEHQAEIARDFVHALAQVDTYRPSSTTARFARQANTQQTTSVLLEAMKERMAELGYAIQLVDGTNEELVVQHKAMPKGANDFGEVVLHEVMVGEIGLRRAYATSASGVLQATSQLFVRGYDASRIQMGYTPEQIARGENVDPAPAVETAPVIREESVALIAQTNESANGESIPGVETPATRPLPASEEFLPDRVAQAPTRRTPLEIQIDPQTGKPSVRSVALQSVLDNPSNIWDLGESNYTSLLSGYGNISEKVLIFPNDSMRLGDTNKAFIRAFMQEFNPDSDIVSIVGCSLGSTSIANGNEVLAKGRADRVRKELLFSGVEDSKIFDEGCWASDAHVSFPSRGVVMTIKRRG